MSEERNISDDLLRKFNEGSQVGYEFVFESNYKKLCYFANSIVDSEAVSQDIVQDVFVKLWQIEKNFESFDKLSSFLYVAVRNHCFNYIKTHHYKNRPLDSSTVLPLDDSTMDDIITAEMLSTINQAISTLPSECRKVMDLTMQGYSSVEIAKIMNLTSSTVRTQKARGIQLLKPKLPDKLFLLLIFLVKF